VQSAVLLGGLGIGGAVALSLAGSSLQRFFHAPIAGYIPWLAVFVALSVPVSMLPVAAMVDRRSRLVALVLAGFGCLSAAALMVAAWWGRDLYVLLVVACGVMAVQAVALVAYLTWRARSRTARPGPALLREQLAYAVPFAAAALVGLLRDRIHAFYIGSTMTAAQFAVYAVGLVQIPVVDLLTQTVGEVVVLENAAHFSAGRPTEARATWQRAGVALAVVLFPVFAVGEVFAREVITILFGTAYAGAVLVFRVNLLLVPLAILLASPLLRATADLGVMLGADLASLAVAMITLLPLVRTFGPAGAVGSLVAGFATFSLLSSRRNAARLGLRLATFLPWGHLGVLLAVAGGCAGLARILVHGVPPVWRLALGPAASIALYAVIVWRTELLPAADRAWARGLLRRIGAGGRNG
jgi:O-antigen/teichoic acid export membrane protein